MHAIDSTKSARLLCVPLFAALLTNFLLQGCGGGPPLELWHTEELDKEFTADKTDEIRTFGDYLQLEDRLYNELDQKIYAEVETGPAYRLVRYSSDSATNPRNDNPDWNRSFELARDQPKGHVLLLHGMSDSPYSLRAIGLGLQAEGYHVIGLRLPGHGTIPAGIRDVKAADMIAAVRLAMTHLSTAANNRPVHMVGYSTGATLALNYTLDAMVDESLRPPASLVLISPAVRVHRAAAFAKVNTGLSRLPGFGRLAWMDVMPEFDPYKYNSFPSNAGDVVHILTSSVKQRIAARAKANPGIILPPVLVLKSAVDATVTTEAVIDNLLVLLKPYRHKLVLFDINRAAASAMLMTSNPGPLRDRLISDATLPFAITFIGNESPEGYGVIARHKQQYSKQPATEQPLAAEWPPNVISLSHIAVPFPPDDPLYGNTRPTNRESIYLGSLALRGERGLSAIPAQWLLRMRYNPFYSVVESNTLNWINAANAGEQASAIEQKQSGQF
jgi:alpha-beta hydrolase superfamily lysophospholipase